MKDPPTQAVGGVTGVKATESQQTRSNLLKTLLLSGLQVPLPSLRLLRLLQSRLKIRHQLVCQQLPSRRASVGSEHTRTAQGQIFNVITERKYEALSAVLAPYLKGFTAANIYRNRKQLQFAATGGT